MQLDSVKSDFFGKLETPFELLLALFNVVECHLLRSSIGLAIYHSMFDCHYCGTPNL